MIYNKFVAFLICCVLKLSKLIKSNSSNSASKFFYVYFNLTSKSIRLFFQQNNYKMIKEQYEDIIWIDRQHIFYQ